MEALSEVLEALVEMKAGAEEALAKEAEIEDQNPVLVQPLYVVKDLERDTLVIAEQSSEAQEAAHQRERAERAMVASRQVVAARETQMTTAVAAPPRLTEEERQKRVEHHRRQRDMLVQKKNQERENQLAAFKQ